MHTMLFDFIILLLTGITYFTWQICLITTVLNEMFATVQLLNNARQTLEELITLYFFSFKFDYACMMLTSISIQPGCV